MPLSVDEIVALLGDDDPFRMVVRGQSTIERLIDEGIEAAFARSAGVKARSFGGFERRVQLAAALGIILPRQRPMIMACADLRNKLADGVLESISEQAARPLAKTVRAAVGTDVFENVTDVRLLVLQAFALAITLVDADLAEARRRREQINETLEQQALLEAIDDRIVDIMSRTAQLGSRVAPMSLSAEAMAASPPGA